MSANLASRRAPFAVALAVCALVLALSAPSARSADLAEPWVHQAGTGFVAVDGAPVQLRGVDIPGFPGTTFYAAAVDLGVNFVRIPLYWSDFETQAPVDGMHVWTDTQLAKLDAEVGYFEANGVNVLLDFHQFNWSPYWSGGKGIPAWFYTGSSFASRNDAEAAWWTDANGQTAFEAFASMIIDRYRSRSNVVGYEVLNEPQPGSLGQNHEATQAILAWEAEVVAALGALDPIRTFFVSPRQGGCLGLLHADFSAFASLDRVALECHLYFPGRDGTGFSDDQETWFPTFDATHNQASRAYAGSEENQERILLVLLRRADELGIPLVIGEWGARRDDTGLLTYQDQVLRVYDRWSVSWARWALSTTDAHGLLGAGVTYTDAALQLREHLRAIPPTNTALPAISGFAQAGRVLTAAPGQWTGTGPKTYAYAWERCDPDCVPVSGATESTYVPGSGDVGTALRVAVVATGSGGSSTSFESDPTPLVQPAFANLAPPAIEGSPRDGATLSATPGSWDGAAPITFDYRWQRCVGGSCTDVAGATQDTYTAVSADVGTSFVVVVSARDAGGEFLQVPSDPTAPVEAVSPVNVTPPSVTGSPQVGASVTADVGTWLGTIPIDYSYVWQRCDASAVSCTDVGTSAAYTVQAADAGFVLRVRVGAANAAGTVEALSDPTGTVLALPPTNTAAPSIVGVAEEGQTLTGTQGEWSSAAPLGYRYQWRRCDAGGFPCSDIAGAVDADYVSVAADVAHPLSLAVYASSPAGEAVAYSAATSPIAPLPPVMNKPTAAFQTALSFAVSWSPMSGAPIAAYDVFRRSAGYGDAFGSAAVWASATSATTATFKGSPGVTYCFSARARTATGTLSRPSLERCTAVPVDDRTPTATGSWTRLNATGYFQGTASRSTTAGSRLTLTAVRARRLAVLATKGPGAGTVKLSWNGTILKQVSLAATTTQKKQLVAQVVFTAPQTGDLSIVVGTGGAVEIDGVGVSGA